MGEAWRMVLDFQWKKHNFIEPEQVIKPSWNSQINIAWGFKQANANSCVMKTQILLTVLLSLTISYAVAQQANQLLATPGKQPAKQTPVYSRLAELMKMLGAANTDTKQADAYFDLAKYYGDRLKLDSAFYYCNLVKQKSESARYKTGIAKYQLAHAYLSYYRNISERDLVEKSIQVFQRENEFAFLGLGYRMMAKLAQRENDVKACRNYYYLSVNAYKRSTDVKQLQHVNYELGTTFSHTFEPDSAITYILVSLKLAEQINDPSRIFTSAGGLGELYTATEDFEKAARYFEYALQNRSSATSQVIVRNYLGEYATTVLNIGQFDKAAVAIKDYEDLNKQFGDRWGTVMLNIIKGRYYYHQKKYQQAYDLLHPAYHEMLQIGPNSIEVKASAFHLGLLEYSMEKYDSAVKHFLQTYLSSLSSKYGEKLLDAPLYISRAYDKMGKRDSAFHYFTIYHYMKDSLLTFNKEKAVLELTAKYETEKKEQQIHSLERDNELSFYQLRAKNDEIEKQKLLDEQKTAQLSVLVQQNKISKLEASEKALALEGQQREITKKKNELALLAKENELQTALVASETQRTRFAYVAIAAILLFSGFIYYRSIQNKKLSRRLERSLAELKDAQEQLIKTEKEKEAENIRVGISRDIHDEVGATLSGVALFSEIAREKMRQHKEEDAQLYLNHITVNSKEMVEKMSDIIWTINPENDSFERIIAKLTSFAYSVCAGKGIIPHFDIDQSINYTYPSMQVKKNIYLLVKEALNNAVKYSEAKNLYLQIKKQSDHIMIEIKDDGKGFDRGKGYEGNGLVNMQARAKELKGALQIETGEGKGTTIKLSFDFHPAGGQTASV